MTADNPLVIFDCDGTLVDSQHQIITAMEAAFEAVGATPPEQSRIRSIIGLSVTDALAELAPDADGESRHKMKSVFRKTYQDGHGFDPSAVEPLYPGVRDALEALHAQGYLLAVATGNSERGLDRILSAHGLRDLFVSLQTADRNPSKPNPTMLQVAIAEAGSRPDRAVMIGDTIFDMRMGQAAGTYCIGISWGYHDGEELLSAGARMVIDDMDSLHSHVDAILK